MSKVESIMGEITMVMQDDADTLEFVLYVMEGALRREKAETLRLGDLLDQSSEEEYQKIEPEYVVQCEYEYEVRKTIKRVEEMLSRLENALKHA